MKGKKLLVGVVVAVFGLSMTGLFSANADTERAATGTAYTAADVQNLQNFLLAKDTPDLSGKNYDLNGDGVWDGLDLSLMKQQYQTSQTIGKTLVAYYSASGTTERIAEYIAEEMDADVFVITPVNAYTSADLNWSDSGSRVVQEHEHPDTRHVELVQTTPDNFADYDNVFIGYPIWWQEAAWVVDDFVKENDFTGKNVIPFCTSMSSPLGESGTKLAAMAGTGNWLDGMRFSSRSTRESVQEWAAGLDLTKPETASNILIAYLSYPLPDGVDASTSASRVVVDGQVSGSVEYMANVIQKNTGGDLFAIQPAESYGDDFNTVADKALSDQQNGVLPELSDHIANLDQYDTIFVGYPIWWYDMPQLMYSFFSEYDLSGKTIIPFNSHGGSGFSGSVEEIEELEPNATVRTDGLTLSRSVVADSENRIVTWLETIGLKKSA